MPAGIQLAQASSKAGLLSWSVTTTSALTMRVRSRPAFFKYVVDDAQRAQRLNANVLRAIGGGRHRPQKAAAARQSIGRHRRLARETSCWARG